MISRVFAGRARVAVALAVATAGCAAPSRTGVEAVVPSVLPGAPISMATRAGGLVFLAGRTAIDAAGRGIAAEMREIGASLAHDARAAGVGMAAVARCTVFVLDVADLPAVDAAYASWFAAPPPPRTAVQVVATPVRAARVEVECVARGR